MMLSALLVAPLLMTTATPVSAQSYSAMNCGQLWHARNAIYAAKGHCFKTQRGQAVFGKNCFPPYGKLTSGEQNRVATIKQWEVHNSCGSGGVAPAPAPAPAPASGYAAMNCGQLWHARNAIYAAKGYCFKTARAKAVFGKRCYAPFGQLTSGEQSQVGTIKQWEGRKGCR
jgi:hypothetical protein